MGLGSTMGRTKKVGSKKFGPTLVDQGRTNFFGPNIFGRSMVDHGSWVIHRPKNSVGQKWDQTSFPAQTEKYDKDPIYTARIGKGETRSRIKQHALNHGSTIVVGHWSTMGPTKKLGQKFLVRSWSTNFFGPKNLGRSWVRPRSWVSGRP